VTDAKPYWKRDQLERSPAGIGLPKPQANKRTDASPARKAEIRAKKCGECRVCGRAFGLIPINAHHLIPRSLGGVWTESNIVGLCGSGTTGCHGLVEARDRVACAALRRSLTDAEYSYIVAKKGEAFLDRYYPVAWEKA